MKTLTAFFLLFIASCAPPPAKAISYDNSEDGQPRNSWERQQEEYRKTNYDSYRNGMAQEALEHQQREQRRQEEYRRESAERNRIDSYRQRGGVYGGERCRSVYGC